jgi:DNA-binding transcriptional ArsR family regulator
MASRQKEVSAVFSALADPVPRRILAGLSQRGESRVTSLAKPFRISLPAISRHLRVLESARLIQRRRKGRVHLIRARASGFRQAQRWIAECAAMWDSRFDALEELLRNEEHEEKRR